MFTGIIETVTKVLKIGSHKCGKRLAIMNPYDKISCGESIAVNGVCLTVADVTKKSIIFDLSLETLAITTLGTLIEEDLVNLERAMKAQDRFGGHYVSGHIDTVAQVLDYKQQDDYIKLTIYNFKKPARLYLLPKGSITINGVSLTINQVSNAAIQLMLIPVTIMKTNLGGLIIGQFVNIEFDYITRIIAHQLQIAGKIDEVS